MLRIAISASFLIAGGVGILGHGYTFVDWIEVMEIKKLWVDWWSKATRWTSHFRSRLPQGINAINSLLLLAVDWCRALRVDSAWQILSNTRKDTNTIKSNCFQVQTLPSPTASKCKCSQVDMFWSPNEKVRLSYSRCICYTKSKIASWQKTKTVEDMSHFSQVRSETWWMWWIASKVEHTLL